MQSRLMFPRSIRYLLAIAEHKSFTRAAEALYVSQPTLSQQIKQLEEALDTQLLDRSGRTVRLTEAGEVFLRHARRALGELDAGTRAVQEVRDLSRGSPPSPLASDRSDRSSRQVVLRDAESTFRAEPMASADAAIHD